MGMGPARPTPEDGPESAPGTSGRARGQGTDAHRCRALGVHARRRPGGVAALPARLGLAAHGDTRRYCLWFPHTAGDASLDLAVLDSSTTGHMVRSRACLSGAVSPSTPP